MIIRNEKKEDYRAVEEMIKKAFWNLYVPGCTEHYFVIRLEKAGTIFLNWILFLKKMEKLSVTSFM